MVLQGKEFLHLQSLGYLINTYSPFPVPNLQTPSTNLQAQVSFRYGHARHFPAARSALKASSLTRAPVLPEHSAGN